MKTDRELVNIINKVREGNKDYFSKLYEESYKYLHTCVIHIVKNEDVAQDMLQETYIEIYRNLAQLKDAEGFLGWASTIVNRKCFAYLKKKKDVLADELLDDEGNISDYFESIADDEAFIPENILDDQEKIKIIRGIIDELTDVQRACVIGFYYNEQKQDEIAKELGIPVNTVKSHLNRAKVKIKEAVGDTEKEQGIKLYSVAPFMLLLFAKEMDVFAAEAKVPAMSASLSSAISSASLTTYLGKTAAKSIGMALRTKVIVGILTVTIGVGVMVGIVAHNAPPDEEQYEEVETVESEEREEPVVSTEVTKIDNDKDNSENADETDSVSMGKFGRELKFDKNVFFSKARYGLAEANYDGENVLMDYSGNILANEDLEHCVLGPTSEGYSVFVNSAGIFRVFDKEGSVVLETEFYPITLDGKYLIAKKGFTERYYDLESGSMFYEAEGWSDFECYFYEAGATNFVDGYSYLNIDGNLYRMNLNGEVERLFPEKLSSGGKPIEEIEYDSVVNSASLDSHLEGLIPVGAPQGGYLLARNAFYDGKYWLINPDGSDKMEINLTDVMMQMANDLGWDWSLDEMSSGYDGVCPIENNGRIYGNMGKNIIVRISNRDNFIDAQCIYNIDSKTISEPVSSISTEGEEYWAYTICNENWEIVEAGYMDYEGNKLISSFEDVSDFYNGRACVKKDGKVYIINDKFEIISEGMECDYVHCEGDTCYLFIDEGDSPTEKIFVFSEQ